MTRRRTISLRYSLFWNVTQSRLVDSYRRFGTPIGPNVKGRAVQEYCLILKDGVNRSFRNVCNYQSKLTSQKSEDLTPRRKGEITQLLASQVGPCYMKLRVLTAGCAVASEMEIWLVVQVWIWKGGGSQGPFRRKMSESV